MAALNENGRGECSLAGPVAKMLPGVPEPVEIVEARTGGPASAIVSWLAPHDSGVCASARVFVCLCEPECVCACVRV